jgi:hypothetical protein
LKGEKERIHKREKWVSNIVIALANELSNLARDDEDMKFDGENLGSFFIWNKAKKYDEND